MSFFGNLRKKATDIFGRATKAAGTFLKPFADSASSFVLDKISDSDDSRDKREKEKRENEQRREDEARAFKLSEEKSPDAIINIGQDVFPPVLSFTEAIKDKKIFNRYEKVRDLENADLIEFLLPSGEKVYRTKGKHLQNILENKALASSGSDEVSLQLLQADAPINFFREGDERPSAKKTDSQGAWFKYVLKPQVPMDLSKYGVYKQTQIDQLIKNKDRENCFTKIFNDHPAIESLKCSLYHKNTTLQDIKKAAEILKIKIILHKMRGGQQHTYTYCAKNQETKKELFYQQKDTFHIGLLGNHYFLYEETIYKSAWVKHMLWKEDKIHRDQSKNINSFQLISCLLKESDSYLDPHNHTIYETLHHENYMIPETAKFNLENDTHETIPAEIPGPKYSEDGKMLKGFGCVYYADIETNTVGKHEPYLIVLQEETTGKQDWWWGSDCIDKALQFLSFKDRPLIYFHNLGYDGKFIVDKLNQPSTVDISSMKCVNLSGYYKSTPLNFHDTLAFIANPLKDFHGMFKLAESKFPEFPYELYSSATTTNKQYLRDHGNYKFIPEKYHSTIIAEKNVVDIVNHRQYASDYCATDVTVLRKGFMMFKKWIKEEIGLDVDYLYTTAGLADKYLKIRGCYEGVCSFSGPTREFLQKSAIGGRVMIALDKNYESKTRKVTEDLYDLDAVSLYPTAMIQMEGLPIGAPTQLTEKEKRTKSFLNADDYCVMVKITKVGKKLKIPHMTRIADDGNRLWTNDMVGYTSIINKITLEDWVSIHDIEYVVLNGLQFNNGFNSTLKVVMLEIFELRKKLKEAGNKAQLIYKLIMNSGYGKSIEKPHLNKTAFIKNSKFDEWLAKKSGSVVEFAPMARHTRAVYEVSIVSHKTYPHVGACILAMSKRVMSKVMVVADEEIQYTDTDSMFVTKKGISQITKNNKDFQGSNPGQFQVDFSLKGTNVRASEGMFLAPKTYCVKVINDENDERYHIRMKGVSQNGYEDVMEAEMIDKVAKYGVSPLHVFQTIKDTGITFDLLARNRVRFSCAGNLEVMSLNEFIRTVGPFLDIHPPV
jgi:hypothetical protein